MFVDGVWFVCFFGVVDNLVYINIILEDLVKYYSLIVKWGLENDIVFVLLIVIFYFNGYLFKKFVILIIKIMIDEGNSGFFVLYGIEVRDGKIFWLDIS